MAVIAAAGLDGPGITARDRLAALRNQQHDTAGAEKLLAEVLAKAPRDDDALFLRGNIALAQKDPKTAIADLRSVLRDQPNAIGVMRVLARAHLANGEPALAEETMRRAVEANPADAAAAKPVLSKAIRPAAVKPPPAAKPAAKSNNHVKKVAPSKPPVKAAKKAEPAKKPLPAKKSAPAKKHR